VVPVQIGVPAAASQSATAVQEVTHTPRCG
jgi:hypothetical protein